MKLKYSIFSEVDPNASITITSDTQISFSNLVRTSTSYVHLDRGVNYFDGNFEFKVDLNVTSAQDGAFVNIWGVSNDVGANWISGLQNKSGIGVWFAKVSGTSYIIALREKDGSTAYDSSYSYSEVTLLPKYLKIVRDEAVGTYGTCYCYIYSDSARTILLSTLTITLHTSKKDYRYLYALNTIGPGDGAGVTVTGSVSNLDEVSATITLPQDLSYTVVNGQVVLDWSSDPTYVLTYTVERTLLNELSWESLASSTSSTYTDTSALPCQYYTYRVFVDNTYTNEVDVYLGLFSNEAYIFCGARKKRQMKRFSQFRRIL